MKNGFHPSLTVNFTILREREVATKGSLLVSSSVKKIYAMALVAFGLLRVEITC